MFATVTYILSGVLLALCIGLFLLNRTRLRNLQLYVKLKPIPMKICLLPLPILALVSLVGICLTSMVYSSLTLAALMAPFIFMHLSCEPLVVKKMTGDYILEDGEFSRMVKYGLRSRKYLLGIVLSMLLMYAALWDRC